MQAFVSFFRTLGPSRIIAMGVVTLGLMGFFTFLIVRAAAPQMSPLFTDLSVEDSSAIIKDLERQGIAYAFVHNSLGEALDFAAESGNPLKVA